MEKVDSKFFKKAYHAAMISDFPIVHVGCVAVYHGTIIGVGYNSNKTHPLQKYYNRYREEEGNDHFAPKLHAEIDCINSIRGMDIAFSKVKLYIYRICQDRPHGLARPCPSCMAAIRDLGIREIYYTTDEGYAHEDLRYFWR